MGSPAEVGQLRDSIDDDDVLWLEIPMDHAVLVQVHESLNYLPQVVGGLGLIEVLFLAKYIKERSLAILEHQV